MKIKPEIFLNSKKEITYKKILITGSDETLITHVKDFVINDFKNRNYFIDDSGNYSSVVGNLFTDKKTLFLLSDIPNKNKVNGWGGFEDQCVVIALINGKKASLIKSTFIKESDAAVIECYKLNRGSKEIVLKKFIENNDLNFSVNVFWYILDNFENNYVFFIKQLQTLALFKKKIELISDIEKTILIENKLEINKIFFNVFKNNKLLTNVFNKNIKSVSDFYVFLGSTKSYFEIISESSNKEIAASGLPRYLFAEKKIFLEIYDYMNKDKLFNIFKQLSKAELMVRKHPDLYSVIGLRFFLNLKKTVIS